MHARSFSLGLLAHCAWNSLTKLTTRELGKHRVVSKHPVKIVVSCTYDDISPKKSGIRILIMLTVVIAFGILMIL